MTGYRAVPGEAAISARHALMDSLAGGLAGLDDPACRLRLGPTVNGAELPGGARVPGTAYELEPVQAAFNLATLFTWQDGRAQWPGAEQVCPGDLLGALLALADWIGRRAAREGRAPPRLGQFMEIWIKATEIFGALAESGLGGLSAARLAISAGATALAGGSQAEIENSLALAWLEGGQTSDTLAWRERIPGVSAQALWQVLFALRGGLQAPPLGEDAPPLAPPLADRVMREIAFSVPPAGSTALLALEQQSLLEAAIRLHPEVKPRLAEISRIVLERAPSRAREQLGEGEKSDPAYLVGVALLAGAVREADFSGARAGDPRLEALRGKLEIRENPAFSRAPPEKPLGHALQVFFSHGEAGKRLEIPYPLGHPRRRAEGLGGLIGKFAATLSRRLPPRQCERLIQVCSEQTVFEAMPVHEFVGLTVLTRL
jgi:2-methylcitrate dehydratase